MKIAIFLFFTLLSQAVSRADYFTTYLWYRAEPELSRIVITDENLRGRPAVDGFTDKAKEHEKDGKYLTRWYDRQPPVKKVTRIEKMDGHEIRTELVIQPPRGLGYGGAAPMSHISVFFDGDLKVDCPIGYSFPYSMNVTKVIIHAQEQMAEVVYNRPSWGWWDVPSSGSVGWSDDDKPPRSVVVFNFFKHGKETIVLESGKSWLSSLGPGLISQPIDTKTKKERGQAQ